MLQALVRFSLRFRGVVIALACAVVVYGLYVATHARLDVYPEFTPPRVVIFTEAPGLSPEEVEGLVTRPVENAVTGVAKLESVRSQSIQGLSSVTAVFEERTDIYRARQMVSERLVEAASQMPQGVKPPTVAPLTSATSEMLAFGLTSETRSAMELRTFADWTLRPRLLGVGGVAKVAIFGGEVRQLQVQVSPAKLLAHDLAIQDVLAAARGATGVRGAGFVENENQRIVLRTEGQALSSEELGETVIERQDGVALRLEDVARVAEGAEPKLGAASIGGHAGVILVVASQFGANVMDTTVAVERALEELKPTFEAEHITLHPALLRPANFIEAAIHNVLSSLYLGGVLVAAVLFLFFLNFRTAFITLTAIPLSLLVALIVLDRFGATINTITLGGLAIAIGVVVDDAIIDVENISRRLRENWASPRPRPAFDVVLDASLEVRSAVVYATFVVALVFLPVLTMSGLEGRLFAPLGVAYILAILASLAVALTVTPALCFALLARDASRAGEPRLIQRLKATYRALLSGVIHRPVTVLGLTLALCVGAAAALPFFGGSFLPEFREGHFIVHMVMVPGTSLGESIRIGNQVTLELLKNPGIRSVAQWAGRAEKGEDTFGPHESELNVDLVSLPGRDVERVKSEIREALLGIPSASFSVLPFLTERIDETLSGEVAAVVVSLYGDDLDLLDRKAKEVAGLLRRVRGSADVQVKSPPGAPQVVVRLRPERLARLGFRPLDVLEAIETAYQGTIVAQVYQGSRVVDVNVLLDPASRRDPGGLGSLMLKNAEGLRLPLRELANVFDTTGRYVVLHDGARRRQAVTCNVDGRDVTSFAAEARARLVKEVALPVGTYAVFSGAAESRAAAARQLFLHSSLAGLGIVLLLAIVLGRARNLLLVLANLPFALVGGVAAAFLTGGSLSIGSLVGFVTLFGITMRNSIMMVTHFEHLVAEEGETWGPGAALRGASERLVPILTTALVTALGLLPLAVGSEQPGREIEGPMAIVILGGLATSTALNLLVLPTLSLRYGRFGGSDESSPASVTPPTQPAV